MQSGIILNLQVRTNSGKFEICSYAKETNTLRIKVKSKPENNAANLEFLKNVSKIFNSSVKILKGFKSRNKTVAVEGGAESLQKLLSSKF